MTVAEETGPHHARRDAHVEPETEPRSKSGAKAAPADTGSIRIGLAEAVLGGRVKVLTPGGRVQLSIPPGTSSGKVLRVQGKGKDGGDWLGRIEIVVPVSLDAESRALISRFAELNPLDPTDD